MLLQKAELRRRVEARRRKLGLDLARLRAEAAGKTNAQIERIERSLDRITVELGAGWDSISEEVSRNLKHWLNEK